MPVYFLKCLRAAASIFLIVLLISANHLAIAAAGPALSVDAAASQHPISPYIYGMNFASEAFAKELKLPVRRWGGNTTTRYNWQNDTSNHASDYFFENLPEDTPDPATLPNGSTADLFVEQDRRTGTRSLITVPILGWVPKSRDLACGFSVAKYGAQQQTAPQVDCGNGLKPDGTPITGNNPTDTSIAINPAFDQAWVSHLVGRYGTAAQGGVAFYALDNEPGIWNSTHRDVHPNGASYDELRDDAYQYAAAIKQADPTAQVTGPTDCCWTYYFYSGLDASAGDQWWQNPLDRNAHGGTPFVEWYLQQMHTYEVQHGTRILDYLDLHYYPEEANVALSPAGDAATQALRLRSTRSLWDPTYTAESWINDQVRLIPRMHDWVAADYPGTKLAISEYNWGGLESINGALTQADVLGIFGREGLDLATMWSPPDSTQPGAYAFRMYLNYDGSGATFGTTSVSANSSAQDQLAIYGAMRGSDTLTLMIINKTGSDLSSSVALAGFNPASAAQVYTYSSANLNAIVRQPDQAVSASGFSATFPANSITLVTIPRAQTLRTDTIGVYRNGVFYLRNSNTTGNADTIVPFGSANSYPIVGDWQGTGIDTIGVYDQTNGSFALRYSNTPGTPDATPVLGIANDQPLSGRWQAGAAHDGIGVFRPSNGLIYLRNDLSTGFADYTMVLGVPGDIGVAGNWSGGSIDSPGVYRPDTQHFYMSNQVCNCNVIGDYSVQLGVASDVPLVGDWVGQGHDGVGVFRPSNGLIYLKDQLVSGYANANLVYGIPNDVPVAGHWASGSAVTPQRVTIPSANLPSLIVAPAVTPTDTPLRAPVPTKQGEQQFDG